MFSAYEGSLYNHDGDSLIFVPRGKRTVTLSDKTTKIGENAFGNYTTKYIFSFAATPPTFGTLNGITPSSVSVYVPKGTVDTYQATGWSSFKLAEIVDKPTIYLSESNIEFYDLKIESLGTKSVYSSIVTPTGLSDAAVTWSSSDTGIATVENGVVKAVAAGNATITASAIIDGETYTNQCNVIVKAIDTDAKVVYVETAGTLNTLLTEDEKANTKKLIVVGNINSDDVKVLRYMAGRDESGNMTIGMLEDLDMSMATGISSLGNDADGFRNCNSLKKIILPKSITNLYAPFEECKNLEEVVLQDGLTSIGSCTFQNCSKLKSINIPSSVTNISSYAFYYCSSLVSINIPSSVNNIDYYTFGGCTNLNSVTFEKDSKLTSIGEYAFQGCSSLASIDLPASTISIGDWAFEDCTKLASVTFEGSKLTSIGNHAFRDCSQITSINLPASVISIGEMAFYNCSSLTEFNIPEDSKLTSVGSGMLDDTRIKSFFIPRGLLDFDPAQCAYEYETWGNSVYILPSALESITVSSSNRMFSAYDGSLYNYDGDSLIYVPRGQKTLSLSDKTTKIGANAFGDSTTKYIFSFAATPPTFGTDALNGITPSSVSVYVPKGTIDAYKATDWSSFKLAEIVDKPTIYLSESDIKFYKIKGEAIENKSVYATIVTPTGLSDAEVTWTSSASDVASVSSQGGITQGTVAGETTITASAVVDGQTIVVLISATA